MQDSELILRLIWALLPITVNLPSHTIRPIAPRYGLSTRFWL